MDNVCFGISTPSADALGGREEPNSFPWSEGLPAHAKDDFLILPWNDLALVQKVVEERFSEIAAIITEPIMCNNGCIPPEPGFLQGLRDICDKHNIALIFDEVICGFRVALGGAQEYFKIKPDLSVFAKALASGYPISVIAGRREWMDAIAQGKVIQAGTMNSGNPSVAAALATLEILERESPYGRMFEYSERLKKGLREAAAKAGINMGVQGLGPIVHTGFSDHGRAVDYRDTLRHDKARLGRFIAGMHDRGIRVIGRGLWYISAAHDEKDIDDAVRTAAQVLETIK
jgi:glutamate-1-semialdehyde 2,1-aminomutase